MREKQFLGILLAVYVWKLNGIYSVTFRALVAQTIQSVAARDSVRGPIVVETKRCNWVVVSIFAVESELIRAEQFLGIL